jgi:putative oxidoreductase
MMNSKMAKWGTLAATGLLTLGFLGAGGTKLSGAEEMVQNFSKFGLPLEFMYFIGACEVAGAIGLWLKMSIIVPWPLRRLAASGLAIIMVGAVVMHAMYDPIVNAIPAIVFLALLVVLIRSFGQSGETAEMVTA